MSLRDALLHRERPTVTYRLLVDQAAIGAARAALATAQVEAAAARAALARAEATAAVAASGPAKGRTTRKRQADADLETVRRRVEAAADAVAAAESTVDRCYQDIVIRAMAPDELEALVAAHPPTRAQVETAQAARAQARELGLPETSLPGWDVDAFRPALMAACVDSDMTADDWAAFLRDHLSEGERNDLWRTVLETNHRTRVADPVVLPKDLMAILSSR